MTINKQEQRLLIIDSHALIYRAYYAFPPTLTTKDGEATNAVFGYISLVLDVISKFQPTHIVAVMDSGKQVARQAEYSFYKANREKTDDLLIQQFPRIEQFIENFGLKLFRIDGIEADDIIATIDHKIAGDWGQTVVVTGDQDLFQLVDNNTQVYLAGRRFSESKLFGEGDVVEKLGVKPENIPDYKGLAGDSSDNIPGVRGIGPKTAVELINRFGNLEGIFQNLDKIDKKSVFEKLKENVEMAFTSKTLATVHRDVPLDLTQAEIVFKGIDYLKVKNFFKSLEFTSLEKKLEKLEKVYPNTGISADTEFDLFHQEAEESKEIVYWNAGLKLENEIFIHIDIFGYKGDALSLKDFTVKVKSGDQLFQIKSEDLKEFLNSIKNISLITNEGKILLHLIANNGMNFEEYKVYDVIISGFVASSARANSLKTLSHFYKEDFSESPETIEKIHNVIENEIKEDKKLRELVNLEEQIIYSIVTMERNGILVDENSLKQSLDILRKRSDELKNEIYKNVGHEFNINSPRQVGVILFQERGLPGGRKTKSGEFSTDARVLNSLVGVDPLVQMILDHREVEKLLSTYLSTLPGFINSQTKRIHSTFDQLGAVSGRFASKNPNLQNIPTSEVYGVNIRNSFEAPSGSSFISFDYSQQELRILAALSGEEVMIDAFNTNNDIHKITAAELFGVPFEEVTKEQRDRGKTVNFSIIYGISAFGLSERMKITREEASFFIKKYFAKYQKVQNFMNEALAKAKEQGFTETILGRKRYNPNIFSNNKILKQAAERELFNFIIQGSAADITKKAIAQMHPHLKDFPAKFLLQIHDEFLFEYEVEPEKLEGELSDEIKTFIEKIKSEMLNPVDIGVAFGVDAKVGERWGYLRKL